ncbi:glycosyltransferase [Novosphingobium sp. MBES04]|uniref:glycosyltransferase n=1 Tax=Novosphingobium sp. MBES04 TaxID=1206458 RepID=UPI000A003F61
MVTGGRERFVAELCRLGPRFGIAPLVILHDPDAPGERIALPGVRQVELSRHEPNFGDRLSRLLARERIDVLHVQGHVSAALAEGVLGNVPSVVTLHMALGSSARWLPAIVRGLRKAGIVSAVSEDLARRFRWLAGKRIALLQPGIDLDRFATRRGRDGDRPFTIGTAARLHPVKRHRDLLAALHRLKQQRVASRLVLAGEGSEEPMLRSLAARLELDVSFCGVVEDMPGWFAGLDAFVLASDHEGSPLALLEAMASSLPCVATSVGGIPAIVGDTGLLVRRRSPIQLADALATLHADGELREQLAISARARAESYADTCMGEQASTLYRYAGAEVIQRRLSAAGNL